MIRLLILPVLLLTLLVGTPAFSADFQKGVAAAQSGDYATALLLGSAGVSDSDGFREYEKTSETKRILSH